MIANRSAPLETIVPIPIYNDVARAIDWLCEVFGLGEDGKVTHAQFARDKRI